MEVEGRGEMQRVDLVPRSERHPQTDQPIALVHHALQRACEWVQRHTVGKKVGGEAISVGGEKSGIEPRR